MTIRYLAEELYRWTRKVDELEKALAALEADAPARNRLAMELLQAKQEAARVRAVLEAKKEQPRI
jgi:Trm5-related predicted tRNA methylase